MSRTLKLVYKDTIRRAVLPEKDTYNALLKFAQTSFNFDNFSLSYVDNEGDNCYVSSSVELEEAFRVAALLDQKSLKLVISRSERKLSLDPKDVAPKEVKEPNDASSSAPPSDVDEKDDLSPEEIVNLLIDGLSDPDVQKAFEAYLPTLFKQLSDPKIPLKAVLKDLANASPCFLKNASLKRVFPISSRFLEKRSNILYQLRSLLVAIHTVVPDLSSLLPSLLFSLSHCDSNTFGVQNDLAEVKFDDNIFKCNSGPLIPILIGQLLSKAPENKSVALGIAEDAIKALVEQAKNDNSSVDIKSGAHQKNEPQIGKQAIHHGVMCDVCGTNPIRGIRYKCSTCPNYDMCEACEHKGQHPQSHALLKIVAPVRKLRNPHATVRRPRAEFVADVTIPDSSKCNPDIVLKKVWKVVNSGKRQWPEGIQIVYTDGSVAPEDKEKGWPVAAAKPGEAVEVCVEAKSPSAPGRYIGNYRLSTESGVHFGPKLWVDVIVVRPELKLEAKKSEELKKAAQEIPKVSAPASPKAAPQEELSNSQLQLLFNGPPPLEIKFAYEEALRSIVNMGFNDEGLVKYLLISKNGDAQACVDWLLANNVFSK